LKNFADFCLLLTQGCHQAVVYLQDKTTNMLEAETGTISETSLLKDYEVYNLWANRTLIDWLKKTLPFNGKGNCLQFPRHYGNCGSYLGCAKELARTFKAAAGEVIPDGGVQRNFSRSSKESWSNRRSLQIM
jgi:hypothetical protein